MKQIVKIKNKNKRDLKKKRKIKRINIIKKKRIKETNMININTNPFVKNVKPLLRRNTIVNKRIN
jgi:hypothetical protein